MLRGSAAHRETGGAGVIEGPVEFGIAIGHDPHGKLREDERGAAVHRQVLHLRGVDHLSGGGTGGIQHGGFAGDGDGFVELPERKFDIDADAIACIDLNAIADVAFEARGFGFQPVDAWCEEGDGIESVRAGGGL